MHQDSSWVLNFGKKANQIGMKGPVLPALSQLLAPSALLPVTRKERPVCSLAQHSNGLLSVWNLFEMEDDYRVIKQRTSF
jgi:hypothetical protein